MHAHLTTGQGDRLLEQVVITHAAGCHSRDGTQQLLQTGMVGIGNGTNVKHPAFADGIAVGIQPEQARAHSSAA